MRLSDYLRVDRRFGTVGFILATASIGGLALATGLVAAGINVAFAGLLMDVCVVALIYACMTVGLQVFVGGTGIVSFGHLGFVAIGAYVAGLASVPPDKKALILRDLPPFLSDLHVPYPMSLVLAMAVPAVVAVAIGPVLMRLSGQAAAVTSFAFLVIVNDVLRNAKSITNGVQTFSGVPAETTLLHAAVALIVVAAISAGYKWSRFGLRSRAVRDDALAAASAGISPLVARLWPWVVSASICGLAGGLWAHYLTAFSPVTFYLQPTIVIIVMLFVGGAMSISGAIAGAFVMSVWMEFARRLDAGLGVFGAQLPALTQFSDLSVAVILIVLLQVAPGGIFGFREVQLRVRARTVVTDSPAPTAMKEGVQ